ncbi:MAG: LysR family transcriptional regulator [Deltaproteobacteria bacterium]|jgi:molybdate transport system regulatory protein|nr:LysR family transcriptional regulator [Deltaproteobacteria bacterium]
MAKEKTSFSVRSKIWIEDVEGNVVFGLGRYIMLEVIGRLGSMNAAARELRMSYRAVWIRIRTSEKRIGKTLVSRQGKGSQLTPFAEDLMKQFKRLQSIVEAESNDVYESLISDHLNLVSFQKIKK